MLETLQRSTSIHVSVVAKKYIQFLKRSLRLWTGDLDLISALCAIDLKCLEKHGRSWGYVAIVVRLQRIPLSHSQGISAHTSSMDVILPLRTDNM